MTTKVEIDVELCHATAAWLGMTIARGGVPMINPDGTLGSWPVEYERINSHGIYATSVLDTLPDGLEYNERDDQLMAQTRTIRLGSRTVGQVEEFESQSVAGPKGAEPFGPEVSRLERVFAGYELAAKLDILLTGENAGGKFFGRGSAHRACVKHLADMTSDDRRSR